MKLYVGNISFDTTESTLRETFAAHGDVEEVAVITDRDTGRPRGFAFVTMPDDSAANGCMSTSLPVGRNSASSHWRLAGTVTMLSSASPSEPGGRRK